MGIRFIRRTIAELQPSKLIKKYEGIVKKDERNIELPFVPLKIVYISIGDKIIKTEKQDTSPPPVYQNYNQVWKNPLPIYTTKEINTYREKGIKNTDIAHKIKNNNDLQGIPEEFYITGEKTIHFVPQKLLNK